MATYQGTRWKRNVTLNKKQNWSGCTKMDLNESWTQGLIAQLVRAYEWGSIVVGSYPTETNVLKLLHRIRQCWIPYISSHSATLMWFPTENVVIYKGKRPKRNVTLNKWRNWSGCKKMVLSASWTHGMIAQSIKECERGSVVVGSIPTQANFL